MAYRLTIRTSDLPEAGTDAEVFVQLHGRDAKSAMVKLTGEEGDFRKGGRDQFKLKLPELGPLQKLTVQHDNSGPSPAWHLDSVEVTNEATGTCFAYSGVQRMVFCKAVAVAAIAESISHSAQYVMCLMVASVVFTPGRITAFSGLINAIVASIMLCAIAMLEWRQHPAPRLL